MDAGQAAEGDEQLEQPGEGGEQAEQPGEDDEVVNGVVVLAGARAVEPVRASPPLRQVAAVAATGFVAGAATAAVLGRRRTAAQARRAAGSVAARRPLGEGVEVVASRRFIVDVHTIAPR